jgi:hypothetical protein
MPALERVVIFDERLYHGNGDVIKWCRLITLKFSAHAKAYAPKRSGTLARSVRASIRNPGPKRVMGTIGVGAPYATFVLSGTHGPIMANRAWARSRRGLSWRNTDPRDTSAKFGGALPGTLMPVGQSQLDSGVTPFGGRVRLRSVVEGQRANNFLERAWRATARNHRTIRGIAFPLHL